MLPVLGGGFQRCPGVFHPQNHILPADLGVAMQPQNGWTCWRHTLWRELKMAHHHHPLLTHQSRHLTYANPPIFF
jgi:hypothetical protein